MSFKEKWLETVRRKNSVVCAGLDPAEFAMSRGAKGLPEDVLKIPFGLEYVPQIAEAAVALKPNLQYWLNSGNAREGVTGDMEGLLQVVNRAREHGLLTILDAKVADIGSTSEAGMWHAAQKGFDAITIAPYAGNMGQLADYGRKLGIATITMCLMSNPEYETVKNMLVDVNPADFNEEDLLEIPGRGFVVPHYLFLAQQAHQHGVDGLVIGAPSRPNIPAEKRNHIQASEIERARFYAPDVLSLTPGLGFQGGHADPVFSAFGADYVICSSSRDNMFPKSGTQAEATEAFRRELNELRRVA